MDSILIVEDERQLNTMISDYLAALGYRCVSAYDGISALQISGEREFQFIILDLALPGMDGTDVARRIRENSDIPIIMLTARTTEADTLMGLELGADDYMKKPFSLKELAARIRTILKRTGSAGTGSSGAILECGFLSLDPEKYKLYRAGEELPLTRVQFQIIKKLMGHPGRVFSRLELLNSFQDEVFEGYARTIDVHIKNIRKIIEKDPSKPVIIETVRGVGYRMAEVH